MLLKTNIEFIDYIPALNLVGGDHLCLGQNSVSISFCQGNCIRELIKINPKKGSLVKFTHLNPALQKKEDGYSSSLDQ